MVSIDPSDPAQVRLSGEFQVVQAMAATALKMQPTKRKLASRFVSMIPWVGLPSNISPTSLLR